MSKTEMEDKILKFLYECWQKGHHESVGILYKQVDTSDIKLLEHTADELERKELIKNFGECLMTKITSKGIIEVESRDFISPETLQKMKNVRYKILQALYELCIAEGIHADLGYDEFYKKSEIDEIDCSRNFDFLREMKLVTDDSSNSFKITEEGLKQFEILQKHKFFKDEFEKLSKLVEMTPQQRGKKLEFLLAEIIEFAGWNQKEIKTSYEQIDIVIHKNREFYLIECKWEKTPSEAEVVDKLFGKLSRRAGTNGIIMSMAGFSKGSVDCVKDFTNQKLILLFGKKDIEQIVSNPNSFEELFNNKYKELVMRREVNWN
jgi:Restriction endonuclease